MNIIADPNPASPVPLTVTCNSGWHVADRECVYTMNAKRTWREATHMCQLMQGHLVMPKHSAFHQALTNLMDLEGKQRQAHIYRASLEKCNPPLFPLFLQTSLSNIKNDFMVKKNDILEINCYSFNHYRSSMSKL